MTKSEYFFIKKVNVTYNLLWNIKNLIKTLKDSKVEHMHMMPTTETLNLQNLLN